MPPVFIRTNDALHLAAARVAGEVEFVSADSRVNGVMHVGLDAIKRTFICYEYGVGVYFPEGETLERIYREIVQEPIMAGNHIGKGKVK